ncbi:MAG: ubiquinol-cytochrome c reductase iron-sulfur subunit [Deltaproteobacteria bacterium]
MALIDDLEEPQTPGDVARRRFLAVIGSGVLGVGAVGTVITTLRFIEPTVIYQQDKRITVGRPEDLAVGTAVVLANGHVILLRTGAGFVALSTVCTHLGCIVRQDAETGGFACPCHGSRFHADGTVRLGPADRALRRHAISVERGMLVVDSGSYVEPHAVFTVPV